MNIMMISNYWHFPGERTSSRYDAVASLCAARGHHVQVVTASFYHTAKRQREIMKDDGTNCCFSYFVTLLSTPGYRTNVSFARIYDHHIFAKKVITYLHQRSKEGSLPDVIYLFVPPAELADRVVNFANMQKIRVIIDIIDLWPQAFETLLGTFATRLLLFPMKRQIKAAYRGADGIAAVSVHNAEAALRENKRVKQAVCVPTGISLTRFDAAAKNASTWKKDGHPVTMAYIGMLGKSYDLRFLLKAMRLLRLEHMDVELLVMGDGPERKKLEKAVHAYQLPVRFTGFLPYEEMVRQLVFCDIAINVLKKRASGTVLNKHADYAAAGLPIINIQSDTEFDDMLEKFGAGFSCAPGNMSEFLQAVKCLCADEKLRRDMGAASRRLAEQYFDRETIYPRLIDFIEHKTNPSFVTQ